MTKYNNGQVVPVLTDNHGMKVYWRSGSIAPRILNLGTRWRRLVSFTPRVFNPDRKIFRIGDFVVLRAVVKRNTSFAAEHVQGNSIRIHSSLIRKMSEGQYPVLSSVLPVNIVN
jgi:hypothetical protein